MNGEKRHHKHCFFSSVESRNQVNYLQVPLIVCASGCSIRFVDSLVVNNNQHQVLILHSSCCPRRRSSTIETNRWTDKFQYRLSETTRRKDVQHGEFLFGRMRMTTERCRIKWNGYHAGCFFPRNQTR